MSLNFDLTAVRSNLGEERYKLITTDLTTRNEPEGKQKWHTVTNTLIWGTMSVGLGKITAENIDEWSFRLALIQKLFGTDIQFGDGRKVQLTRQDVVNHIGLRTNVSEEKRKAWIVRIVDGNSYQIKLASGEPQEGLAISAQEQVDLIQSELLAKE